MSKESENAESNAKGAANRIIDLNSADESTLAGLAMVGPQKARSLVQHRPYEDWTEVEKIPGIGPGIVDVLAMAGVQIGKAESSRGD